MRYVLAAIAVGLLSAPAGASAAAFAIAFEWGDIPLCTSGTPNLVDNPRFTLQNVPAGTKFIAFKLVDLNVPSYQHGGGTVAYAGQEVIEPGAFKYESPCPPSGSHTYEWTARARKSSGSFGAALATARASASYP